MPKTKQQQLEESTDAILLGAKPTLEMSAPTRGERAGRRRDLTLFELAINRIRPDPDQVRSANKATDDAEIQELAASIKDKGVLQPLDVRYVQKGDYYEIIAGERRYTAAKLAGLDAVPVKLLDVSEKDARLIQLIENIHRADLLPTELGAALQELRKDGHSVNDLAKLLRKSAPYIQKALGIAVNLAPRIQKEVRETPGLQTMEHLYALSKLPQEKQPEVWEQIKNHRLTSHEARQAATDTMRQASGEKSQGRGRPAGTKPYSKTVSTEIGGQVTVRFQKTRATTEEVIGALRQAISLWS